MVRQDSIDLLRHPPIIAPQAGLDMTHRNMEFRCSKCSSEHGIGIALNEYYTRFFIDQNLFYLPSILPVCSPYPEPTLRLYRASGRRSCSKKILSIE